MPRRKKPARLRFGRDEQPYGTTSRSFPLYADPAMLKHLAPPRTARPYFTGGSSSLTLARNCPCGKPGCGLVGLDPIPPYAGGPVDSRFAHNVAVKA